MQLKIMASMAMLCALAGCGGYNESTPEGFYKSYVKAWASSDMEKVLSMHFVTDARPNGLDYSRAHVKSEILAWQDESGDRTPMKVCKQTLKKMSSVYYSQDDETIKVMNAVSGNGATRENLDPSLTIIKVDGRWKVQSVWGSKTSRQDWVSH